MNTPKQRQTVLEMGKWLASKSWAIFSTITYKYDIKAKQNYRIMKGLDEYLQTQGKPFNIFLVIENTNHNFSTHNHLLLQGDIKYDINYHLKSKSLIVDQVKHETY